MVLTKYLEIKNTNVNTMITGFSLALVILLKSAGRKEINFYLTKGTV